MHGPVCHQGHLLVVGGTLEFSMVLSIAVVVFLFTFFFVFVFEKIQNVVLRTCLCWLVTHTVPMLASL